jgi:hypothetical protein
VNDRPLLSFRPEEGLQQNPKLYAKRKDKSASTCYNPYGHSSQKPQPIDPPAQRTATPNPMHGYFPTNRSCKTARFLSLRTGAKTRSLPDFFPDFPCTALKSFQIGLLSAKKTATFYKTAANTELPKWTYLNKNNNQSTTKKAKYIKIRDQV